ncbi:hypothetical protein E2C01_076813 [Portunus trituberculatus]|uniref:Uncharacterized protein n=1 Tax=Portunus trituberculatus TaxID=210409 RepID=A0A5B7IK08_PORTR|nr:hypothetical protein [Portunus trituberculatus]
MPSKFASLPRSRPSNAPAHSHASRLPQPDVTPVQTQAVEGVCRQPLQSFQQVHTQPQHQETPSQRLQRSGSITQHTAGQKRTQSPVQRTQSPIQRTQSPIQRTHSPVQHVQSPIQRTQPPMIRSNSLSRRPETSHHHHHHHHKNAKASKPSTQDTTLTTTIPTTPTTTSTPATTSSGDGGRPRFPHDFVRQNSLRSKGETKNGGGSGGGGGEHGKEKRESASSSVSAASNHR